METGSYFDLEVARKSTNIMSFVKQNNRAFTSEELVRNIFNVSKNETKFYPLIKAVNSFLRSNKDFNPIQDGIWSYGSKPVIRPTVVFEIPDTNEVTQSLSFVERVKGYIKVSQQLAAKSRIKLKKHGTLDVNYAGCSYEFQWKWQYNHCYLYGDGVMDFLADGNLYPD